MWGKSRENISGEVKNNMCNGACSRCGECCGLFIPFNDNDIKRIKKYVSLHKIQPVNRIDIMTGTFKAHCCFYDEISKKCTIYPVRPFVCRDFRCDREDWKVYRDMYEKQCKYNSSFAPKTILATFDDLIYKDYTPIIKYLLGMLPVEKEGVNDTNVYLLFKSANRLDLFNYLTMYDENGKEITGKEFVERYEKNNKTK